MLAVTLLLLVLASSVNGHDSSCIAARKNALEQKDAAAYLPQCDEHGNWRPVQCHFSKNECWCVNSHGDRRKGTFKLKSVGYTAVECTDHPDERESEARSKLVESAEKEEEKAAKLAKQAADAERAAYTPKAVAGKKATVNEQEEAKKAKRLAEEAAAVANEAYRRAARAASDDPAVSTKDTPCRRHRREVLQKGQPGEHVPQCDEAGGYTPVQCHFSTGLCWCVDSTGKRIPGARTVTEKGYSAIACSHHDKDGVVSDAMYHEIVVREKSDEKRMNATAAEKEDGKEGEKGSEKEDKKEEKKDKKTEKKAAKKTKKDAKEEAKKKKKLDKEEEKDAKKGKPASFTAIPQSRIPPGFANKQESSSGASLVFAACAVAVAMVVAAVVLPRLRRAHQRSTRATTAPRRPLSGTFFPSGRSATNYGSVAMV